MLSGRGGVGSCTMGSVNQGQQCLVSGVVQYGEVSTMGQHCHGGIYHCQGMERLQCLVVSTRRLHFLASEGLQYGVVFTRQQHC